MGKKKSKSSRRWLQEHFNDPFVKEAQLTGFRSRAVFKLQELQDRDKLFKTGMTIFDLGAAPGGWSQVLGQVVGKTGRVIAVDLLPMDPIPNVEFIQADFTDESVLQLLLQKLDDKKADWVVSDMAPNMSGIDSVDQPKSIYLAELALDFAIRILNPGGGILIKVFQGEGFEGFLKEIRQHFKKVVIRKPKASRDRSREVYLVGNHFIS